MTRRHEPHCEPGHDGPCVAYHDSDVVYLGGGASYALEKMDTPIYDALLSEWPEIMRRKQTEAFARAGRIIGQAFQQLSDNLTAFSKGVNGDGRAE